MELIPAIDIIGGRCVRLTRGDYNTKKEYGDPLAMAKEMEQLGFRRLHVVDLDGAKSKHVVNIATLKAICQETSLTVDFGGGVKTNDDLEKAFEAGASMVTAGSIAVTDRPRVLSWIRDYGADHIIIGADARKGMISINGWMEDSTLPLDDFIDAYMRKGATKVLCTDISRDGTLTGPATDLYRNIMKQHPTLHLIASGGVCCMDDLDALEQAGVPAVVFGKAIYEGRIDLKELAKRC